MAGQGLERRETCSDTTTTLSILAFSLRTSEYLVEQLRTQAIS